MQADINGEGWPSEVQILGINFVGREAGNEAVCQGRELPWLQDTPEQNVWGKWNVKYRDVIILDADNVPVAAFNLTDKNLAYSWHYDALVSILRDAAYSQ
jgi:hypothetical protein